MTSLTLLHLIHLVETISKTFWMTSFIVWIILWSIGWISAVCVLAKCDDFSSSLFSFFIYNNWLLLTTVGLSSSITLFLVMCYMHHTIYLTCYKPIQNTLNLKMIQVLLCVLYFTWKLFKFKYLSVQGIFDFPVISKGNLCLLCYQLYLNINHYSNTVLLLFKP